ncbi:hypothetical protein [Limnoglobus roseus]|uniref:SMI1/KNR4 family protein n=1 Tax=Limnoglobus roseus TaxID=2598579 RepID=A0A5C1ABY8_9BACT|nr:hypothetical protein [Limnoglobus roseus]QEL15693.1 SMI1/KNR4 family protein [Limnoglobus roseus]
MTETEWQVCADPTYMMRYLRKYQPSERKSRLFAIVCCHRIEHRFPPDDRCRSALDTCERYVEGLTGSDELAAAYHAADQAFTEFDDQNGWETSASAVSSACSAKDIAVFAESAAREAALLVWPRIQRQLEYRWQSQVLRCLFGNPFHASTIESSWLTSTAIALAEGIYADKAFDRLPILADALQDTGCENADILTHLRGDGPHVRGCWALDLVLGKE